MKNLSDQNKLRGRPPFGWKFISKDLPLEKDIEQQKVINIIKNLYSDNKMNYSNIAYYLNLHGLNYCLDNGRFFYPQTIKIFCLIWAL